MIFPIILYHLVLDLSNYLSIEVATISLSFMITSVSNHASGNTLLIGTCLNMLLGDGHGALLFRNVRDF